MTDGLRQHTAVVACSSTFELEICPWVFYRSYPRLAILRIQQYSSTVVADLHRDTVYLFNSSAWTDRDALWKRQGQPSLCPSNAVRENITVSREYFKEETCMYGSNVFVLEDQ